MRRNRRKRIVTPLVRHNVTPTVTPDLIIATPFLEVDADGNLIYNEC